MASLNPPAMKRTSSSSSKRVSATQDERESQRQKYRKQLESALEEEEDPLAVYDQFIQWTLKNYSEDDPKSGLIELLEECTRKFKNDSSYKTDLRYLKLWTLYAKHCERHGALSIYKYLMTNDIGVSYSLLYEEYAAALELEGRKQDADTIYRRGIKKQVRPLERLKSKHKDFQKRINIPSSTPSSSSKPTTKTSSGNAAGDTLRKNPLRNHTSGATSSSSQASPVPTANFVSISSTAASRYALMMAPPAPGKRPEKLRFNLNLLFSDGMEYSIQEARARSMGLLGKKWGPPPYPSSSAQVDFNDDGLKSTKNMTRRKSLIGGAEPTVTINTKEALADVFGMYNSPEKTKIIPGSKHAPVKKVEPIVQAVPPRLTFARENENVNANNKTPSTFRPFVDENVQPNRVTPAAKFTPFVDPDAKKTPTITPRQALTTKDVPTPVAQAENAFYPGLKPSSTTSDKLASSVFSKVFAPATNGATVVPHHDTRSSEEAKKEATASRIFVPFVDESAKTPFKVFSRPGENNNGGGVLQSQNGFTPKTPGTSLASLMDKTPAFTPFRDSQQHPDVLANKTSTDLAPKASHALGVISEPEEEEEAALEQHIPDQADTENYDEDYQEEYQEVLETPAEDEEDEDHEAQRYYREAPLGGRFGQFNVMTPITERTCEFTMGTTPKDRQSESGEEGERNGSPKGSSFIPLQIGEREALINAERLAAELREVGQEEAEEAAEDAEVHMQQEQRNRDHEVTVLEEKTTSLTLAEKLSLSQSIHFSNPCNPFEHTILSSLLSRIPSDDQFFDLRAQTSTQLEALEKFAKKSRKSSRGSNNNGMDLSRYTLTLGHHCFMVSEKIGEGGFGSVFKAQDVEKGAQSADDESEDDFDLEEEDEECPSFVAIKVVKPRNTWEYHVLRRLHNSLPSSLRRSLVLPHALYAYSDESFLILDLCPQGMLLSIINNAVSAGVSQQGACLDELLVMFFSIELIRLVEGMHAAGFIHGDLKIDNCLLRLEEIPGGASAWTAMYQPSGDGGWSYKGLKVIDFGRTIDTKMFPSGQEYLTDWPTDERDCLEMRQGRPWTYQTDYFGLAGIIFCMLFGKYIQESCVGTVPDSPILRYKISTPLKRYWQGDIWNRLFDVLLNPCLVKPNGTLPICDELAAIRKEMEAWLEVNCNRSSNTLKGLLKKVEKSCYTT